MSCRLKDYYKEGVPLEKSMRIVSGLIDQEADVIDKVIKDYSSMNLISRNLESLGFLEFAHPPAAPIVTIRGGTLILSGRPFTTSKLAHPVAHEMARFVLLKAIRDTDWDCFREFFAARFINLPRELRTKKAIMDHLRKLYYPQFSAGNMNHWYGLHLSFVSETCTEVLSRRGNVGGELEFLDPYDEKFAAKDFFARPLREPTEVELRGVVEKALSIYKNYLLGSASVGYSETLKTIIEALLLGTGLFESELRLSQRVMNLLKKKGVSLMRSNYPMLTGGRGFVDYRGNEQTSFKLFSLG
jgi:hypothetical protein